MAGGGAGQEQRPLLAQQVLGRHVGQPDVRVGEHHQAAVVEAGPVRGEGAPLVEATLARDAPLPQVGGAPPAAPAAMTECEDDDWAQLVSGYCDSGCEDEWLQCQASKYLTFILLLQGNSGLRCKPGVQFPVILVTALTSRVAGSTAARAVSAQTRGTRAWSPGPGSSRPRSRPGICN